MRSGSNPTATPRGGAGWRNAVWAVLGIVLACALVVGASGHGAPATSAQRAGALDAELRCPSCDDLSVADSSAASAVAIRQLVLADAEAGIPDSAIVSYLQSKYPGIVLRPPASGIEGLVWFAPLGAFAIAICIIGAVFWRRQHVRTPPAPAEDDRRIVADALRAARSGAPL